MIECVICWEEIPQGRIDALAKMGKKTNRCVKHADVDKYTGHIVVTGKTGDEIEVIRNGDLARHLNALDKSRGFKHPDRYKDKK